MTAERDWAMRVPQCTPRDPEGCHREWVLVKTACQVVSRNLTQFIFFFFPLELVHQDISSVTLGHRCWAQESVQSHSQSEPFTRLVVGLVCVLAIFEASKYE